MRAPSHDRLPVHVAANYVGKGVSLLSVYLFVPLFFAYLGPEAYGMVGFFAVLQGLLAFADLGLGAALSRETARLAVSPEARKEIPDLLRTVELLCFVAGAVLVASVVAFSGLIGRHWLQAEELSPATLANTIILMGLVIAAQLAAGVYQGGLMGLQHQVTSNVMQVLWALCRSGGAVVVLSLVSPTLYAFFGWQLAANLVYLAAGRHALWRAAAEAAAAPRGPRFSGAKLKCLWPYAAGMAGITLIYTLLGQLDKLVVSRLFLLEDFGHYALASMVSQAPVLLIVPLASAVFPRMTGLVSLGNRPQMVELYHRACRLVSAIAIPTGLLGTFFSFEILATWTGSTVVAERVYLAASLLTAGCTVQALTVIPYNLAIAHGWTRLNLVTGAACCLLIVPLLAILVREFGLAGAGSAWFLVHATSSPLYLYLLHRQLLPGGMSRWLWSTVAVPALGPFFCVLVGRVLVPSGASDWPGRLGLFATAAGAFASSAVTLRILELMVSRGRPRARRAAGHASIHPESGIPRFAASTTVEAGACSAGRRSFDRDLSIPT